MDLLLYIIAFNFIGSIISLSGGVFLFLKKDITYKFSHYLASFAAGSLLGAVFFDLLPEALHESEEFGIAHGLLFLYVLFGILFFFILERALHWFHHHDHAEHTIKGKPVIPLLIIGDTVHNFIDGIAIAAAFLVNIPAGIITAMAVGAHEIPQEIGDFGIMLKHRLTWKKILSVNFLSASASFLGVLVAYFFGMAIEGLSVFFISVAAGFFLYISLSDIIPEIHHENKKGFALWETVWLFLGVAAVYMALFVINDLLRLGH